MILNNKKCFDTIVTQCKREDKPLFVCNSTAGVFSSNWGAQSGL